MEAREFFKQNYEQVHEYIVDKHRGQYVSVIEFAQEYADQQTAHLIEENKKLREALEAANNFIEKNRSIFDVPAFHLSEKIKQALNESTN